MHHACVIRFDIMGNFKKFLDFEINISTTLPHESRIRADLNPMDYQLAIEF